MRYRTSLAVVAVAVAVAACTDAQDPTIEDLSPAPTAVVTTTPTATPTADETSEPATESAGERIEVTVSGGEVEGPGTVTVEAGTDVELVVTSDVADHVHVHGYDLFEDVGAGETVTLSFTADIPGVFEVELEDSTTHLLELEVRG